MSSVTVTRFYRPSSGGILQCFFPPKGKRGRVFTDRGNRAISRDRGRTAMALRFDQPIRNVFVLMLENRSFDHLFARSGIAGITAATAADDNRYAGGAALPFSGGAPAAMAAGPQ